MNFSQTRLQTRIQWQTDADRAEVETALAAGHDLVVQFSRPPTDAALAHVEALAQTNPDRVTLRFYGFHGKTPFDLALQRDLRHVRRFDLDCLDTAGNIDALADLTASTHLSLEIYELSDKDILHRIDPTSLSSLRVGDMKTKAIDGTALSRFRALETVFLSNSVKSHDGLRGLPALRHLQMRARPKDSYAFLADCPALQSLSFFLGGAPDMDEVRSDTLTDLSVIRCRGVDDMGDLSRFPKLRHLTIEDQIRLERLDLIGAPNLESLRLINCKALARIDGLEATKVSTLQLQGTALDLDAVERMERAWTRLALGSGRRGEDTPRDARLAARGLGLSHFWAAA
ncbi:hypothetical protein [Jannaschia donghaensis]|uniref:Leucine Rich repeats (2 copies) n=1 Tax=Jannaschia donghaensis TaxID=420998 RepID=A0A0M6YE66_9RHOB|nr:hypothetical protein [Jannaschia donghaensis]CTQ48270.1 hypothetical protein JDO7802_00272 [Jannaschia donghaensis]